MPKSQILEILYKKKEEYVPIEDIASTLDVSKTDVSDDIQSLREEGYHIEFLKSGYRLIENNLLLPYEIKSNLQTEYTGEKIHHYKEVDSTNEVAKKLAEEGAKQVKKEGEASAQKILKEADAKANDVLKSAKEQSDKLLGN